MSYEALHDELRDTRLPLNNGAGSMPAVGFGTLFRDPGTTTEAVKYALETGFRHFDCAERYRNEDKVGDAFQQVFAAGHIRREEVFITTKLWNTNHRPERVRPAFEASCQRLQVAYIDCYLIHTPFAFQAGDDQDPRDVFGHVIYDRETTLLDTWRALESLVEEGRCGSIGLSDITLEALKLIVEVARIKPSVVQIESHPYLPEWEMLEFCKQHGIIVLAFAPLGHGMEPNLLEDPVITGIAHSVQKTAAQVALAWAVQRGTAFLTTSATPGRIRETSISRRLRTAPCGKSRMRSALESASIQWSKPASLASYLAKGNAVDRGRALKDRGRSYTRPTSTAESGSWIFSRACASSSPSPRAGALPLPRNC